jgi:SPP1 gp7 family putative phage head morphogenesis protein
MPDFITKPVPHTEAAKFLAGKPVVAREVFDRLLPDLQARAFTLAGVENANVMQGVRDLIAEIPRGADWDKVKGEIAAKVSPYLGEGAERRAELVMRQHGFQAYQAAQYEVMDRQRAAFPYWQYQTAEDDRVRESHAALNGVVMPADSPFWDAHYPPWDWGCRCFVVPLTEDDVAEMQAADAAKKPEERRVLDPAQQAQLETAGIVQRAPDGGVPRPINVTPRADAPRFNPQTLRLGAADLRPRYDAETWATFERWAKAQPLEFGEVAGRTVWDWMNAPAPRAARAGRAPRAQRVNPPAAPAATVAQVAPAPTAGAFDAAAVDVEREAIRTAAYKTERRISAANVNETIKLKNGRTVIFKPRDGEDLGTRPGKVPDGTQHRREVAASILDQELRLGLVPPTTLLTYNGRVGSAQLWKEEGGGWKMAGEFKNPFQLVARLPERMKQDWQLFDDLVAHLDRHGRNLLFREIDGRVEVALIDNGLSAPIRPSAKRVRGPLEGAAIDATNLAKLDDLLAREREVRAKLEPYLEPAAIDLIFVRARILKQQGTYGNAHPDY